MSYRRWTPELRAAAERAIDAQKRVTIINVIGDVEHWDWDNGKQAWRRLTNQFERSRYGIEDVRAAVASAIAFGGIDD